MIGSRTFEGDHCDYALGGDAKKIDARVRPILGVHLHFHAAVACLARNRPPALAVSQVAPVGEARETQAHVDKQCSIGQGLLGAGDALQGLGGVQTGEVFHQPMGGPRKRRGMPCRLKCKKALH